MRQGPGVAGPQFSDVIDVTAGGSGLAGTRKRLRDWLWNLGVREPQLNEILLAAGEACANAVEHSGARSGPGGPAAWIEATHEQGTVRIVVSDLGLWKEPDPAEARSGRRGRGRMLMANLMDFVDIATGPTGTVVQLTRRTQPAVQTPPPESPVAEQPWVRLSTYVPEPLKRQLKLYCTAQRIEIRDAVTTALEWWLANQQASQRAARSRPSTREGLERPDHRAEDSCDGAGHDRHHHHRI